MKKKITTTLAGIVAGITAVLLALALTIACENAGGADTEAAAETPPAALANFSLQTADIVKGTASAEKDAPAGIFGTENGVGDVSYSLVNGTGAFDNDLFSVDGERLVIARTLEREQTYKIRARATDSRGRTLEEPFTVEVFGTAGSPRGISAVAGQRTLSVTWTRTGGAEAYRVAYSSAANFAGKVELDLDYSEPAAEITGLQEATQYYVQVRAKFPGDLGMSNWSITIPADSPTGDPIDAFWYTGNYQHLLDGDTYPMHRDTYYATAEGERVGWDSGTDCYYFVPNKEDAAEGEGVHLTYGAPGVAIPYEDSIIVYHKKFDIQEAAVKAPGTLGSRGSLLYMADGTTIPAAGVFIYKHLGRGAGFSEPTWVYYSTYYWGLGGIQRNPAAYGTIHTGKYLISMGNSAAGAVPVNLDIMPPRPAHVTFYSPTFAHAKANYTLEYMNYHIAFISIPWYQRVLSWLGKYGGLPTDGLSYQGWLENTTGIEYTMPSD